MTSPRLKILERQFARQNPERIPAPADSSGLGASIDAMVQEAVQQQVADALERQPRSPRVRELMRQFDAPEPTYTDFKQIPPTPRAIQPKAMEIQFQRDELNRVSVVSCGTMQFYVQRDQLGKIVRMVPSDIAPLPPAIKPPFKAEARKYDPGEPR
jgi:hypothetical protein